MNAVFDAYINALLADATYALKDDGLSGLDGPNLANMLLGRMTNELAEYIGANFTVIHHLETYDIGGTGFDATAWRENATGKIYVSMQGTKSPSDFWTELSQLTSK